jgi:hypothetical protein
MAVTILDSTGATQTVQTLPAAGQGAKAASLPVVLASDDDVQAKLGIVTETAPATDTASSGLNGRLQRVAQRLSSLIAQLPASLGTKTAANSLSVVNASDDPVVAVSGTTTDAAVANGSAGTIAGYLRSIKDAATDTTTSSPVKIDQTTPGTTNGVVVNSVPALTKGTQAANGFTVQPLRDAGRNTIAMTAEFTFAQTAETLLTMTLSQNGGTTTTFTSRTITSGKKFRIQAMFMEVEALGSGTTPQRAYLRLRVNTAGATTTSSPLQAILGVGVTTAIVKATEKGTLEFPEGLEFNGDGTATFGLSLETPDWVTSTATGRAKITVIGYEY